MQTIKDLVAAPIGWNAFFAGQDGQPYYLPVVGWARVHQTDDDGDKWDYYSPAICTGEGEIDILADDRSYITCAPIGLQEFVENVHYKNLLKEHCESLARIARLEQEDQARRAKKSKKGKKVA